MRCVAASPLYFDGTSRAEWPRMGLVQSVISFNNIGAPHFMSGLRARSACVAMMLAAFTPLLAGCDESSSAVSATQPAEPDVSIVVVKPQSRAVVRELPGRIAP